MEKDGTGNGVYATHALAAFQLWIEEERMAETAFKLNAPPNNGLHPTGISVPVIENLCGLAVVSRRVMPGVLPLRLYVKEEVICVE